mgnify:CR=1 FL=1
MPEEDVAGALGSQPTNNTAITKMAKLKNFFIIHLLISIVFLIICFPFLQLILYLYHLFSTINIANAKVQQNLRMCKKIAKKSLFSGYRTPMRAMGQRSAYWRWVATTMVHLYLSIVYLTYIYRISTVYLPCIYRN